MAGLYGEGRPVRLANDRFEQFQMGLKRHAFWMKYALLVDRKTLRFRAMRGEFKCDGGGRANYSTVVGMVGATAAQSIYYLPRSDFSVATLASRAVEGGSMRGFGTLQTMSATEMLVDEAAAGTRHRRHRSASEECLSHRHEEYPGCRADRRLAQ